MKKQKIFTFLFISFTSVSVSASHCKYLSAKAATQVFEELKKIKTTHEYAIVDRYCKACGDTYIKPIVMDSLEYRPHQVRGYASVLINGSEIDFAYLYLEGANLGAKYNCDSPHAPKNLFTRK